MAEENAVIKSVRKAQLANDDAIPKRPFRKENRLNPLEFRGRRDACGIPFECIMNVYKQLNRLYLKTAENVENWKTVQVMLRH